MTGPVEYRVIVYGPVEPGADDSGQVATRQEADAVMRVMATATPDEQFGIYSVWLTEEGGQ